MIFQVIKKLRSQKVRPNISRISYRLEQLHGVSLEHTTQQLDGMVIGKQLMRVESKGKHSYRIVTDSLPDDSSENSMSELLIMALNDLTAPELKGRKKQKQHFSLKELRMQIYKDTNPKNIRFLSQRSPIWKTILDDLCKRGTVHLVSNNTFALTKRSSTRRKTCIESQTKESYSFNSSNKNNKTGSPASNINNEVIPTNISSPHDSITLDNSRDISTRSKVKHQDIPLSAVGEIQDKSKIDTIDSDGEDDCPISLLVSRDSPAIKSNGLTLMNRLNNSSIKQTTVAADANIVCLSPYLPDNMVKLKTNDCKTEPNSPLIPYTLPPHKSDNKESTEMDIENEYTISNPGYLNNNKSSLEKKISTTSMVY